MQEVYPLVDRTDIDRYESHLADFRSGLLDSQEFTSERLLRGIYAQRQNDRYMVRSKLPGGNLDARQLRGLAEAVERWSRADSAHITTRQDIQLYHVTLDDTPKLLRLLARYGITTREAGGNTVRNITTCALTGVCPHERVDVEPYASTLAGYFLRHPLTQSLPRKFKITFAGCETDCAFGRVQDLAFIATQCNGRPGFRVLVGGGLGASPRLAMVLESFIDERDLLPVTEAVLALHDKYSDRSRRSRSRLKFLVDRFGPEGFVEKYRQELKRTRSAFDGDHATLGDWRADGVPAAAVGEPEPVRLSAPMLAAGGDGFILPVSVFGGNLRPDQFRGLSRILDEEVTVRLRCTQTQKLVLLGVPAARLEAVLERLRGLDLGLPRAGDDVVSCPGAETCPLAITMSARMARVLNSGEINLRMRINGCHNGCAWAEIADIGLIGKARRHHGQMVPCYALRLGGGKMLGLSGPDIPAVRMPSAIKRIQEVYSNGCLDNEDFTTWSRRKGKDYFDELLAGLARVRRGEIPFLIRDQGDSAVFQVAAAGMGECAGSQSRPVDRLLLNAAYEATVSKAFLAKQKYTEVGECLRNRLRLTGQALLLAAGVENGVTEILATGLRSALPPGNGRLATGFAELDEAWGVFLDDPDETHISVLLRDTDAWVESARMTCRMLQARGRQETDIPAGGGLRP